MNCEHDLIEYDPTGNILCCNCRLILRSGCLVALSEDSELQQTYGIMYEACSQPGAYVKEDRVNG